MSFLSTRTLSLAVLFSIFLSVGCDPLPVEENTDSTVDVTTVTICNLTPHAANISVKIGASPMREIMDLQAGAEAGASETTDKPANPPKTFATIKATFKKGTVLPKSAFTRVIPPKEVVVGKNYKFFLYFDPDDKVLLLLDSDPTIPTS